MFNQAMQLAKTIYNSDKEQKSIMINYDRHFIQLIYSEQSKQYRFETDVFLCEIN